MRLSFSAKLLAIVGIAAFAFLVLILASTIVANRADHYVINIRDRYVPKVELEPRLEGQLERIRRGFQDAVAAHDLEALVKVGSLKDEFFRQLDAARSAVDQETAVALHAAIDDYVNAGTEVSRRIIGGETGESLVDAMRGMQAKQMQAQALLQKAVSFDHNELSAAFDSAVRAQIVAGRIRLAISVACLIAVLLLSLWISRGVLRSLASLSAGLGRFGEGNFAQPISITSDDELGDVALAANQMAASLQRLARERDGADWVKSGYTKIVEALRGELAPAQVASHAIRVLASHLEAPAGAFYAMNGDHVLRPLAQHARGDAPSGDAKEMPSFRLGEHLIGQAALQNEIVIMRDPPADYLRLRSALGDGAPRVIVFLPLAHLGAVIGVIELALLKEWSQLDTELLLVVRETIIISLEVARARARAATLLEETQALAQRLSVQEEELRATNEELQAQQEELRQSNDELSAQAEELAAQQRMLEQRNVELDEARAGLERKAAELTTVSAYKSQFLTNMSHELRTPLNSMLLLSSLIAENATGNLTPKQVEYGRTILSAGKDLLALINQVLDLAKVEAGKQEIHVEEVSLGALIEHVHRVFEPLARDKKLQLTVEVAPTLPAMIKTDHRRVEQILTNLLGNAIKFTREGEVALRVARARPETRLRRRDVDVTQLIEFVVSDTGIGIAPADQERIFAPFEQIEAAPDRRYGGSGLGLAIAREITGLLGGELQLESTPGKGSTFRCFLPETSRPEEASLAPRAESAAREPIVAARDHRLVLVIEDDAVFADVLSDVIQAMGLEALVASTGEAGLRLAKERGPIGIVLDVKLPDMDGWKVMDALRLEPKTAAIPVHFVSAVEGTTRGMAMGAVGYLTKPATQTDLIRVVESLVPQRATPYRILVVEDDDILADSLLKQLAPDRLTVQRAATARAALEALKQQRYDCMILDLSLPDMDGLELLQLVEKQCGTSMPSVVVYTARALTRGETRRLEAYTEAIVLKDGSSAERLLTEIRLFMRRLQDGQPLRRLAPTAPAPVDLQLNGKQILIADDDMRTVYALSAILVAKGAEVIVADTGINAIEQLSSHPGVAVVLMDIMMPEMDGYEAMRRIRKDARFVKLPIIALTAKAMKGDQEKCIEAGASDYLSKPIDPDRLIALLHTRLA